MNRSERRQYSRYDVKIGVTVHKNSEEIPATMVDISEGGIGILCDRAFSPGTNVRIPINYLDDFAVHGAAKWTDLTTRGDKTCCRMGIEAEDVITVPGGDALQARDLSASVKKLVSTAVRRQKESDQALKASEERLRLALEGAELGLWDHDLATGRTVWGLRLRELLGLSPDRADITIQDFFARIPEADRLRLHGRLTKMFKSGVEKFKDEFRITRQDGKIRWMGACGRLYRNATGRPIRMTGVNYDITERKQTEKILKENEQKFRSLFENLQEAAAIYEPVYDERGNIVDGILRDANPKWIAGISAGVSKEDVVGKRLSEFFGLEAIMPYRERISEVVAAGRAQEFETLFMPLDRYYFMSVFPVGKELVASASIDITDIKKSEEALRRARDELEATVRERTAELKVRADQLARLTSELTLAEERERRRLAEKLHDHLQQLIVGAKINLETLPSASEADRQPILEKVRKLLAESLQATRLVTAELSPPILASGNLSAALKWLAKWMRENHGLSVKLRLKPEIELRQKDLAVLLFRSVRELLFNIVKHAGVKSARLEMARDKENCLRIRVRDRGRGFDVENFRQNINRTAGFGLLSVHERLALMGGRLEVESSPGQGASFTLIVPLDKI